MLGVGVIAYLCDEGVPAHVILGAALAECLDSWTIRLMKPRAPARKLEQIDNENMPSYDRNPDMYVNQPE